jgi:iron complex transport system substrate-binding protein
MQRAEFSRRQVLGGALALGAFATGCGSSHDSTADKSDAWSFTDDRRKRIQLAHAPKRVVAYVGSAAALRDFGIDKQLVGVFGPTKLGNGKPDVQAGNLDIKQLTIVGNTYGEFDLEKYAALRPDLLVTNMYQPPGLWFVPDDSKTKILELAPAIGIKTANVSLPVPLQRYETLAGLLGADLTAKPVREAKTRFNQAAQALRKTARAGRIRVLAASASTDLFYVSDPRVYADLSYYRRLGVDFVVPDNVQGGFFENLSWEKADKYPADLIMLDNRTAALQPKDLKSNPTWSKLPAVKAGQIFPWLSEPRFSYAGCAPLIEEFTRALRQAKTVAA